MTDTRKAIDVAVAILQRPDGTVLWCSRPEGKPYAGYWEFPGGKVEPGETVWQALVREIDEELGIRAQAGGPWLVIEHDYPHAKVRLHFMRVWQFEGEPLAKEGQGFCWASLQADDPRITPILPATLPLLKSLSLPTQMWLTQFERFGVQAGAQRLADALAHHTGLAMPLVQFREKALGAPEQVAALTALLKVAALHELTVLINSDCEPAISHLQTRYADGSYDLPWGIHWAEHHLLDPSFSDRRTPFAGRIQTASVHSAQSLAQAGDKGLHAAVLGTVLPSKTHPDGSVLGWAGFEAMAQHTAIPVYAIGGLSLSEERIAHEHGAHGVAVQRAWSEVS